MLGLIWAARQTDPGEVVLGLLLLFGTIVIVLIVKAIQGEARLDIVLRGGAPYCPRCNRQVSYRRDYCRACGYRFKTYVKTYGPSLVDRILDDLERKAPQPDDAERRQAEARALEQEVRRQQWHKKRALEREAYYRNRGVEPGPWAWYKILPDWAQAILLGLAISVPVLIGAIVYAMSR